MKEIQFKLLNVMLSIVVSLPVVLPLVNVIPQESLAYKIIAISSVLALFVMLFMNFRKSDDLALIEKYKHLAKNYDGLFDGFNKPYINHDLEKIFSKKELKKLAKMGFVIYDEKEGQYKEL